MNIQAAIFDMDGVLVDSELYWKKYESEIYPQMGVKFTEAFAKEIMGLKVPDIVAHVKQNYNPDVTEEKAYALYDAIAKKVYAESNMMPGASALLNELKREGIPMAIGSSSTDYWIQLCLDAHDLHDYFDLTYSAASMNLPGKPDPSVYVKLMQDLGVDPTCSIVFEDSPTGFAAAVASGGVPVAIADPRWCDGPYPEAALEATSFENITLDRLNNLLTPHY